MWLTLVLLVFTSLMIGLHCRQQAGNLRDRFLEAAVILGVGIGLTTEGLSAFGWIGTNAVRSLWSVGAVASLLFAITGPRLELSWRRPSLMQLEMGFAAWIVLAVVVTGILARVPPSTWDSMNYHLARTIYWRQNRHVGLYPTDFRSQVQFPPWSEYAMLQLQLLDESDRGVNFVQWTSFAVAIVGASVIVRELGGTRLGQWLAALLVATLPMAILQASTSQNDLAAGAWLVTFVAFGLRWVREFRLRDACGAGAGLGLALMTKTVAILFAIPFLLLFGLAWLSSKQTPWRMRGQSLLPLVLLPLLLNGPIWARNFDFSGSPLGPQTTGSGRRYRNQEVSPRVFVSNLSRHLALHLIFRWDRWNRGLVRGLQCLHEDVLGMQLIDPANSTFPISFDRAVEWGKSRHEDHAGNPLHAALLVPAVLAGPLLVRRGPRTYPLALVGCVACYCLVVAWQPWSSRLHLPFFLVAVPWLALVLQQLPRVVIAAAALGLAAWACPYLMAADRRPLGGDDPILSRSGSRQQFANAEHVLESYTAAGQLLRSHRCRSIGLISAADQGEYLLWLQDPARPKRRWSFRHLNGLPELQRYANPEDPAPDAIVAWSPEPVAELEVEGRLYHLAAVFAVTANPRSMAIYLPR